MTSFRNGLCWVTILLCISCTRVKVGDDELQAVNKVVELIGGRCAYGLRFEATPKGRSSYFTLTLSESKDLELLSDIPEMPASGAAYTFYSNLTTPKNYTHIEVSLKNILANNFFINQIFYIGPNINCRFSSLGNVHHFVTYCFFVFLF